MSSAKRLVTSCVALAGLLANAGSAVASNARRSSDGAILRVQTIGSGETAEQREIAGPSLQGACDEIKAGDVDIPMTLGPRETAVDAAANFTDPRSLHLGDITVLSLHDRSVKLRFAMTGVRPPPFPAACPQGQALVTIGVNVVVMARH